jgi:hypothetical protein
MIWLSKNDNALDNTYVGNKVVTDNGPDPFVVKAHSILSSTDYYRYLPEFPASLSGNPIPGQTYYIDLNGDHTFTFDILC